MTRSISCSLLAALSMIPAGADEPVAVDAGSVSEYIRSCRKPNGAFGPVNQHYTDAAWNYPAVATLRLLGATIDRPEAILENGLGYPDGHVGYGHWQFFHRHRIRNLLGDPIKPKHRQIRLVHQGYEVRYYGSPFGTGGDTFFNAGSGPEPDPRDIEADELGFYNLSSLYYLLSGLNASGRDAANPEELISWVRTRQAPGGGFVDLRLEGVDPDDDDAHVAHTFQAVSILGMLNEEAPNPESCARFARSCQEPGGGFRWHPDAEKTGNIADVYYTWAALRTLRLMKQGPDDEKACRNWLNSLQNADGGFGDKPGWPSRLYSTFLAIDALAAITGGDPAPAISQKERTPADQKPIPTGRFEIFQGLNKVPVIEPGDLEGLHDRKLNLLALKSHDFTLAESLREAIRKLDLPMDVVLCPEAYPHRARISGGAVLHHIANPTLDPGWTEAQRTLWGEADAAGEKGLPWPWYQRLVLRPIRRFGSQVYPEQDFEREHAIRAYDAGLEGDNGYNAILAGFNWSPRDFVRVFPWRERYVDQMTPIADADAHGDLEKWSPQLDHTRHLFIAKGPRYEDFLKAAANGRVVCVIRNEGEDDPPVTVYGPQSAVAHVKERMDEWKWW